MMGNLYFRKKPHEKFEYHLDEKLSLTINDILSSEDADELIELQEKAKKDIFEEINILNKEGLIQKLHFGEKNLFVVLVKEDSKIVGYGYGHNEYDNIYLINTIYVLPEFRRLKIGTAIIASLMNNIISNNKFKDIKYFKGITQSKNKEALKLLKHFGFKQNNLNTIT